jgi:hypothetical protein
VDFSDAFRAAKNGERITRTGWNGPGQWVAMSPGFDLPADRVFSEPIRAAIAESGTDGTFAPYLMMHNAQGVFVPWVPSQGDLFAEDWATV